MSKDKNWSDLTKKEKDNAQATAVAAVRDPQTAAY